MAGELNFSGGRPALDLRFQANLLNQVSDPIVALGLDFNILTCNRAAEETFCLSIDQVRGHPLTEYVESDGGALCRGIQSVLETSRWSGDLQIRRPDGTRVLCQISCSLIRDPAGRGLAVVAILRDMTAARAVEEERIRAIEALRHHSMVLEQLAEAVIGIGPDWRFRTWNKAAESIFGWRAEEIIGRAPLELPAWPADIHFDNIVDKIRQDGAWAGELPVPGKGGRRLQIFARVTLVRDATGAPAGAVAVIHDLSDRKLADETIRRLARLVDSVSDVICSTDLEFRIQTVNHAAEALYGFNASEVIGLNARDVLNMEYPNSNREDAIRQLLETGSWTGEVIHHCRDGRPLTMVESRSLLRDAGGRATGVVSVARDLTYLREAEDIMAVSEERFRAVVETAREGIITTDSEGNIISWNNAAADIFGYNMVEILGESALVLLPEKIRPEQETALHLAAATDFHSRPRRIQETTGRHRDGHEIPLEFSMAYWEARGRRFFTVILRDISERKKAEAERSRLDKLDSLGVLAGGIAHDFNNILTAILGNISLARLENDRNSAVRLLEDAEEACHRATGLTRQLLTFAKGGAPVLQALSLPEMLMETVNFTMRGSGVNAEFMLDPALWPVDADPSQLTQVVQNIVLNAIQAMPSGGNIWVRARNEVLPDGDPAGLPSGKYTRVEIQDSGPGIPPDIIDKVFDPYFTTKTGGTGLGLCASQSIIRRHGGIIRADSPAGGGAIFTLYLPATEKHPSPRPARPNQVRPGQGRLLIMDDEPAVRMTSARLFERQGYEVTVAATGEEALRLYEDGMHSKHPFNAVILDLTVRGGMGGRDALARLLALDPLARAIVSSGYAENEAIQDYRAQGFKAALPKPYSVDTAAHIVRDVINEGREKPVVA